MNAFFMTLMVGISLSMDAFSLALIYGTYNIEKRKKIILSSIVGMFHFFMPLIGVLFGNIVTKYLIINVNYLVFFIFLLIGLEMIISSLKKEEEKVFLTIPGFFLFGLSVSIDSLTTGIGLNVINNNYIEVAFVFAITSAFFTYLGLFLGRKIGKLFENLSTVIGGILLIVLGVYYLIR
jgi:manganese efflux pump family protein